MVAMAAKTFPVLFIAPGDVSEAVLASGLLKKLHDEAPNPRFTIVANRKVAPLFADMPKVEQLVVSDRRHSGRRWFGLLRAVRGRGAGRWWSTCRAASSPGACGRRASRCAAPTTTTSRPTS